MDDIHSRGIQVYFTFEAQSTNKTMGQRAIVRSPTHCIRDGVSKARQHAFSNQRPFFHSFLFLTHHMTRRDFTGCEVLTDYDVSDLEVCFDSVGRADVQRM